MEVQIVTPPPQPPTKVALLLTESELGFIVSALGYCSYGADVYATLAAAYTEAFQADAPIDPRVFEALARLRPPERATIDTAGYIHPVSADNLGPVSSYEMPPPAVPDQDHPIIHCNRF